MNTHRTCASRRLLVVDDDHDLVAALCEWIGLKSDWAAVGAYGSNEAVAKAALVRPDVVLLDMEIDGADGFDTARRLSLGCGSKIPALLALTGNAQLRDAALQSDCFAGALLKPADLEGLLSVLDTLSPLP